MSWWLRWLAKLPPRRVILALAGCVLAASLVDHFATEALTALRAVVWSNDRGVRWLAVEQREQHWLAVADLGAMLARLVVLFVLPLAAGISAAGSWAAARVSSQHLERLNLVVAMNTLVFLHRDVGVAFKRAADGLTEPGLERRGLIGTTMRQPDGTEVRAYTRATVLRALQGAEEVLRAEAVEIGLFPARVYAFPPKDAVIDGGRIVDLVSRALGDVATLDGASRWRVPDGEFAISLGVQGPNAVSARVHTSSYYALKILSEAITNAVRSVRRRRASGEQRSLASGAAIEVTVHVTNELLWVYVLDTGLGLRGIDPIDLAVPGPKPLRDAGGFGFGLYIAFALERLGVCSYFLTDAPEGGALARVCFARAQDEEGKTYA